MKKPMKSTRIVRSWLTNELVEGDIPPVDSVSKTVPDQVMSLRMLLKKHNVSGIQAPGGVFDEEDDDRLYPDLRSMDLTEIDDLKSDIAEEIRFRKSQLPKPSALDDSEVLKMKAAHAEKQRRYKVHKADEDDEDVSSDDALNTT